MTSNSSNLLSGIQARLGSVITASREAVGSLQNSIAASSTSPAQSPTRTESSFDTTRASIDTEALVQIQDLQQSQSLDLLTGDQQAPTLLQSVPLLPIANATNGTTNAVDSRTVDERLNRLAEIEPKFALFETRLAELAQAYKAIRAKSQRIEGIVRLHTPIQSFKQKSDVEAFEAFLKETQSTQNEVESMSVKLMQMTQSHQVELQTQSDMNASLQKRLLDREEEINRLKHSMKLQGISPTADTTPKATTGASTPIAANAANNIAMDSLGLKLKVRELSNSLKKVTEERNRALEHISKIEVATDGSREDIPPFQLKSNLPSGSLSTASSTDDLPLAVAFAFKDGTSSLEPRLKALQEENKALRMSFDVESNAHLALKSVVKSLREDNDRSIDRVSELEEAQAVLQQQIADLDAEKQVLVDQDSSLNEECEKLRLQVKELTKGNPSQSAEQVRQEVRERSAALEYRLRSMQQKLSTVEALKEQLEASNADKDAQIQMLEIELQQIRDHHSDNPDDTNVIDLLRQENASLSTQVAKSANEASILKSRVAQLEKEASKTKKEAQSSIDSLNAQLETAETRIGSLTTAVEQITRAKQSTEKEFLNVRGRLRHLDEMEQQYKNAQQELQASHDKLDELQSDLRTKQEEIMQTQLDREASTRESNEVIDELRDEISKLASAELVIQEKETEIATLRDDRDRAVSELAEAQAQLSKRVNSLEAELETQTKKADELTAELQKKAAFEIQALSTKEALEMQLASKIAELNGSISRIQNLESELTESRTSAQLRQTDTEHALKQAEELCTKLKSQISELESSLKSNTLELNEQISEKTRKIDNYTAQVQGLQKQLEDAQGVDAAQLLNVEAELRDEKSKTTEMSSRIEILKRDLESLETKYGQACSESESLKADIHALKAELSKAKTDESNKNQKLVHALKEIDILNTQSQSARDTIDMQLKRIDEARHEKAIAESKFNSLRVSQAELQSKLGASERTKSELESTITELSTKLKVTEQESTMLKKAQAELESNRTADNEAKSSLDGRLNSTMADVEKARHDLDEAQKKIQQLQSKYDFASAESKKLKAESITLNARIDELTANVESTQSDLVAKQVLLDDAQAKVQALEKQSSNDQQDRTAIEEIESKVLILQEEKKSLEETVAQQKKEILNIKQQLEVAQRSIASHNNAESKASADVLSTMKAQEAELEKLRAELAVKSTALVEMECELSKAQQLARDEEGKKSKSIQLLRNSKTRILKLESDIKAKTEATEVVKADYELKLQEKDLHSAGLVRQIEGLQMDIKKMRQQESELDGRIKELSDERDQFEKRILDIRETERKARDEALGADERVRAVRVELDACKEAYAKVEAEMKMWNLQVQENEGRIEVLDAELETSKRLFQSKSIENDQMKLRISELEASVFDANQESAKYKDDLDILKRDTINGQKSATELQKEVKRLEKELKVVNNANTQALQESAARVSELQAQLKEYERLKKKLHDIEAKEFQATENMTQFETRIKELQEDLDEITKSRDQLSTEMESSANNWKMRETQLRNLNSSLKEELRKINKQSSKLPSADSSPRMSIISDNDQQKSPVLTSPSTVRRFPSLKNGSTSTSFLPNIVKETTTTSPKQIEGPTFHQSSGTTGNMNASRSSVARRSRDSVSLPDPQPEYLKNVVLKFLESKDKRVKLFTHMISILLC